MMVSYTRYRPFLQKPLLRTNSPSARTYSTLPCPEKEAIPVYIRYRRSRSAAPLESRQQRTARVIANTLLFLAAACLLLTTVALLLVAILFLVIGSKDLLETSLLAFGYVGAVAFVFFSLLTTACAVVDGDFRLAVGDVFLSLMQGVVGMGLLLVSILLAGMLFG